MGGLFGPRLGYWGCSEMDGPIGDLHPWTGARIMGALFDPNYVTAYGKWFEFTLLHSRFLAKRYGKQPSRLCMADKLAVALSASYMGLR